MATEDEGFKVGDGFVEVSAKINESKVKAEAGKAGKKAGEEFGDEFDKSSTKKSKTTGEKVARDFGTTLNARLKTLKVEPIDLKANPAKAMQSIALVEKKLRDLDQNAATAEIKIEAGKALADIERLKKTMGFKVPAEVKVDVDKRTLNSTLAKFNDFGGKLANSVRLVDFSGIVSPVVALGAAAVAASPLVVSLASSLGLAGGAGLAAIPAVIGFGGAIAGIKGALAPVGEAVKEYGQVQDALRKGTIDNAEAQKKLNGILGNLRPSVRGLVVEMVDWKDRILPGVTKGLQDHLLPALTRFLDKAETHIPLVSQFLFEVGENTGEAVDRLTTLSQTALFRGNLATVLYGSGTAMRELVFAAQNLIGPLFTIGAEGVPMLQRFAFWVNRASENFSGWIEAKRQSGELARFMKAAADEAAKWGSIVGNFLVGFVNILRAANPSGRELATNLQSVSQRFREWTETDFTKIQTFFDKVKALDWGQITKAALAITGLVAGLKLATGAIGAINGILTLFALGPVGIAIGIIAGLGAGFTALYLKSESFRNAVNGLANTFREKVIPALKDLYNWWQEKVLPFVQQAIDNFLPRFKDAIDRVSKAFSDNKEEIKTLVDWLRTAAEWFMEHLYPKLGTVAGFLTQVLSVSIGVVINQIGMWVNTVKAVKSALETLGGWISGAWNAISSAFTASIRAIGDAWNWVKTKVGEFAGWIGAKVTEIKNTVTRIWSETWEAVSGKFLEIKNRVVGFLADLWIVQAIRAIVDNVKIIWGAAWDWVSGKIQGVWNFIRTWIGERFAEFRNVFNLWLEGIKTIWNTAWTWVKDKLSAIWGVVWGWIQARWADFKNVFNLWLEGIKTIWSTAWGAIRDKVTEIWGKVSGVVGKMRDGIRSAFNTIKGFATDLKDHFVSVFDRIGEGIRGGINKMIDVINRAIGAVNKILPKDIPLIGKLGAPAGKPSGSGNQGFSAANRRATGGPIHGPGTGTSDSIPAVGPGGAAYRLSNGEHVLTAKDVQRMGGQSNVYAFRRGLHEKKHMDRMYAGGGAIDDIISEAAKSGAGYRVTSTYRPGDPGWHGSSRAVDFGGYNQHGLAGHFMKMRSKLLELIHTTNQGNYYVKNGRVIGTYGDENEKHRDHVHVAAHPGFPKVGDGGGSGGGGLFDIIGAAARKALSVAMKGYDGLLGRVFPGDKVPHRAAREVLGSGRIVDAIKSVIGSQSGDSAGLVEGDGSVMSTAYKQAKAMSASAKVMLALFEAGFVESGFRNLGNLGANNDHDSLGFLQQRPSQGWGTAEQIMNVAHATRSFVSRAQGKEGRFGNAGALAQSVQVSAFPDKYHQRRGDAIGALRRFNPAFNANGYASGIENAPRGPAWTGENGPELLNFRGGESVTPAVFPTLQTGAIQININGATDPVKTANEVEKVVVGLLNDLVEAQQQGVRGMS